ncbi:MAG TPA: RsmE family RNA methyltransferase, partial [Pyrinomonadaceae bacterium]|nr:RsmE family RNA methyltransferase [Pyrinomonadaceae bacterium]
MPLPKMTRRRFYAPPPAFHKHSVTLVEDEARHLREVLRLKAGNDVYVFDGEGKEFLARIKESRRDSALLDILEEVGPARSESPLKLTIAIALLKGEKFDFVVQKVTELGVIAIAPLITKHADIRLRDESDAGKRLKRWQRIAMEAAKQSGRAVVPAVSAPALFETFITQQKGKCVMFSERDGQPFATLEESSHFIAVI